MLDAQRDESPLLDLVGAVRRRLVIVVVCAIAVPAIALTLSLTADKEYRAAASLLFRDNDFDQAALGGESVAPYRDPTREGATNLELASLGAVARRTAARLGERYPVEMVEAAIDVSAAGDADVVDIIATSNDPREAALLANTYAMEFIKFRRDADRSEINEAIGLVEQQLVQLPQEDRDTPVGQSLREQAQRLRLLSALQTGNAELVQTADPPPKPSAPRVKLNTALGALVGLLSGVVLAFLFSRLDRRLRSVQDVERILRLPLLGSVPDSRALARAGGDARRAKAVDIEPFRTLRTNLRYFNVDREIKSLLITSASPGDGKSTVAWNLAIVAGITGGRVLIMEADLRNPSFERFTGHRAATGLSQVLAGQAALDEAKQELPVTPVTDGVGDDGPLTIEVVQAGPIPPNPAELLESGRMQKVLRDAEERYDLVIVDTPPTPVVSDAVPLVRQVSGLVIVTRLGATTSDKLTTLRDQLANLNAPSLGVVVNGVESALQPYYGYGQEPERAERVSVPAP